jgi:hypothetical protein
VNAARIAAATGMAVIGGRPGLRAAASAAAPLGPVDGRSGPVSGPGHAGAMTGPASG